MSGNVQRGEQLYELGRYKEALHYYGKQLGTDPDDWHTITMVAFCEAHLGRHDKALKSARSAVSLAPEDSYPHYVMGIVCSMAGNPQGAIVCLKLALKYDADSHLVVSALASCYAQAGNWNYAMIAAEKALSMNPVDEQAMAIRAHALAILGKPAEATDEGLATLALNPESADALATNGHVALHIGRHREAIQFFEGALRAEPHNEYAREGMFQALRYLFPPFRWYSLLSLRLDSVFAGCSFGVLMMGIVTSAMLYGVYKYAPEVLLLLLVVAVPSVLFLFFYVLGPIVVDFLLLFHPYARKFYDRSKRDRSILVGALLTLSFVGLAIAIFQPDRGVPVLLPCLVWLVVTARLESFSVEVKLMRFVYWLAGPAALLFALYGLILDPAN